MLPNSKEGSRALVQLTTLEIDMRGHGRLSEPRARERQFESYQYIHKAQGNPIARFVKVDTRDTTIGF